MTSSGKIPKIKRMDDPCFCLPPSLSRSARLRSILDTAAAVSAIFVSRLSTSTLWSDRQQPRVYRINVQDASGFAANARSALRALEFCLAGLVVQLEV